VVKVGKKEGEGKEQQSFCKKKGRESTEGGKVLSGKGKGESSKPINGSKKKEKNIGEGVVMFNSLREKGGKEEGAAPAAVLDRGGRKKGRGGERSYQTRGEKRKNFLSRKKKNGKGMGKKERLGDLPLFVEKKGKKGNNLSISFKGKKGGKRGGCSKKEEEAVYYLPT